MGLLLRLPAVIFIILAASIAAFAVAVNKMPTVHEFYESNIKEYLEEAEYIFTWIGAVYFVLPMIAFALEQDWTRIYFDCFYPLTLWLDAVYSAILVIQFITFVGEIEKTTGRIAIEYGGVPLQLSSVFVYTMLKQSNDPNFDLYVPHAQNILALVFMLAFGFSTLLQLQFKYEIPEGYGQVAWNITYLGMFVQVMQPLSSLFFRVYEGNFEDDEPTTRNIKLCAAVLRMSTLLYDLWLCTSKGYWHSSYRKPFAAMTLVSFCVSCVLVVCRYIGPETLKAGFDAVVACIKRRLTATKDSIVNGCNDIQTSWGLLCTWMKAWVKVQRAKKALASARRRNAGLSLEEHFGALRV